MLNGRLAAALRFEPDQYRQGLRSIEDLNG